MVRSPELVGAAARGSVVHGLDTRDVAGDEAVYVAVPYDGANAMGSVASSISSTGARGWWPEFGGAPVGHGCRRVHAPAAHLKYKRGQGGVY